MGTVEQKLLPTDLVLVAFMPNPRDMEIARVLGWYRIPLRKAPKVILVDWLAFYQPATFGRDHQWRIEKFAPVRGHELVPRGELLQDELDHPRVWEEYYKIQLGPMVDLEQPILADKWKRVTFLYTTGERLINSKKIEELTVKDEERTVLWKALRERALKYETYAPGDLPEFPIPKDILLLFGYMTNMNVMSDDPFDIADPNDLFRNSRKDEDE